tara:strand:+ start:295 stop:663 length:369 start_codon:yes stop_codon:yes gene_type:complete
VLTLLKAAVDDSRFAVRVRTVVAPDAKLASVFSIAFSKSVKILCKITPVAVSFPSLDSAVGLVPTVMKFPVEETVATVKVELLLFVPAKVIKSPGWKLENGVPLDEIVPVATNVSVPRSAAA